MQPHPVLLITRPAAAARRFAAQAAGLGLDCVIAPLLRIDPMDHDRAAAAMARGLVFTSENAVPAAGPGRGRPAICVGPQTAAAARAAGFDVTEGPGDAARMMPLLQDLGEGWLHLRGAHVAAVLPVPGIVVYDQTALPLPDAARQVLAGNAPVILPLFSPRSARLAAAALAGEQVRAPLWLAPISPAADAVWTGPAARRAVASTPDAAGVLGAIAGLTGAAHSSAATG
ncbi:MAG TPA: uroporphyrinogen-III synthase [Paracoccus sp. (in: a-proteobacteria)]|mgnify:CR=1 FL=1|nr:uroporphyrinogen-III synthase [Paracoccus sp. (in: a-proteobacteria)]